MEPAGTGYKACILALVSAVDAAGEAGQRHVRKISSEIHKVVTNPISNSISYSLKLRTVAGSCETGLLTAMRQDREQQRLAARSTAQKNSGSLALVERERCGVRVMLDTAAARAHTSLRHDIADRFFALAAAGSDAELELQFVERVDALRNRGTDFSVGHRLAHADDHGDTR